MIVWYSHLSALMLLLFPFLLLVKVDGQNKYSSDGIFVKREELYNKEVLAMTNGYGLLAVATVSKIHLFSENEERRTMGRIQLGLKERTKFLELKMFSQSELFYCDEYSCGLCTYSGMESSCSSIQTTEDIGNIQEILSASAVKMDGLGQFMLSISYLNDNHEMKMATLRYDATDQSANHPVSVAVEPSFMHDAYSIHGFERDGFVYFVTTNVQQHEPTGKSNVTVTKIVRICASDQTPEIASKISVLVGCDGKYEGINSRAEAAIFEDHVGALEIIMKNPDEGNHFLCRFKMTNLEKRFNSIWDTCQQIPFTEVDKQKATCNYPPIFDEKRNKKGCLIYSRLETDQSNILCAKYGRDNPLDNCQLHNAKSRGYQYGWLEDYNVLQGELMMKVSSEQNLGIVSQLMADGDSYFSAVHDGLKNNNVIRMTSSNISNYILNWKTNVDTAKKFSIARISNSRLLYITRDGIRSVSIKCESLYHKCEDLENGGFMDSLKCGWCADARPFYTTSEMANPNCKNFFRTECPPEINHINIYSNNSGFLIHGNRFMEIENPKLLACDIACTVSYMENTYMNCDTAFGSEIDSDCDTLHVVTTLGGKMYKIPYNYVKHDQEVQTDAINAEEKKRSPGWKIALAILSVLLLIFIVVLLVYFMRNRITRIKSHVRPALGERIENEYGLGHINGLNSHFSINGENYVKIFRSLPPNLKIDFQHLKINVNDVLGHGYYGVVYPATYSFPKGCEQSVVCKFLKEGSISEFYDEAQTMSAFDHPNILRLVGVALDNVTHMPIIVTPFMAKGDLKTYISEGKNNITMRDLFQFAIEIAKGMEHIHSRGYIHRDLAARNCMLDENMNVYVADFGLCRKINAETQLYNSIHDRRLPIRWFPPEIVQQGFAESSDVWSFGVLIWELFTRGAVPYVKISSSLLLQWLNENEENRLEKPQYCPQKLYVDVMKACWRADPMKRPTFAELVPKMQDIVSYMEGNNNSELYAGYERVSNRCWSPMSATPPVPVCHIPENLAQNNRLIRRSFNRQNYQNLLASEDME